MDNKTEQELQKIGKEIPKDLLDKGLKKTIDREAEDVAREMASDLRKHGKGQASRALNDMINSGALSFEKMEVNQKTNREIDRYYEQKIKQGIESGRIAAPKQDKWMRENRKRFL